MEGGTTQTLNGGRDIDFHSELAMKSTFSSRFLPIFLQTVEKISEVLIPARPA